MQGDDLTDRIYILERLAECADTIARLVVIQAVPDRAALLVMDRALRTIHANGLDI